MFQTLIMHVSIVLLPDISQFRLTEFFIKFDESGAVA